MAPLRGPLVFDVQQGVRMRVRDECRFRLLACASPFAVTRLSEWGAICPYFIAVYFNQDSN